MDAMSLAAAPAPVAMAKSSLRDEKGKGEKQSADGGGEEPNVIVRTDFRSTILWLPDVKTGADGTARVPVKYPDSLTGWKATARAVGTGKNTAVVQPQSSLK